MLIGLSLLVASLAFCFYKAQPQLWALPWLVKTIEPAPASNPETKVEEIESKETKKDDAETTGREQENPSNGKVKQRQTKADSDRTAMPPPSFVRSPPPAATPSLQLPASSPAPPSISAPVLNDVAEDDDYVRPSFPAVNSAQRAGGQRSFMAPPRLNPVPVQPPLRSINGPTNPSPSALRAPIPNRGMMPPPARGAPSSLAPPPTHTAIPTKPRLKVELTPGHSPLDWATLTSSGQNLRGVPDDAPYLKVPHKELRNHNGRKGRDAWTVLGGRVYNITPYLPYHPGGEEELLKCAGRNGDKLFNEVHPWVNWENMLSACLIGISVKDEEVVKKNELEDMD